MKKVLIVSYMFPPMGGGGVQRIKHLSEFLYRSGYQVTVFTEKVENYKYDVYDDTNKYESGIDVICPEGNRPFKSKATSNGSSNQVKSKTAYVKKLAKYIVELIFPDTLFIWVYRTYKFSKSIERNSYDFVISSVRPPSNALVGHLISRKANAKHIVEYRDLWFGQEFQSANVIRNKIQKAYQDRVLKKVEDIVCVSPSYIKVLKKYYPSKRYHLIMNGYNLTPIDTILTKSLDKKENDLKLGHFGRFYGPRTIDPLISACIELSIDIEIHHYGPAIRNSDYYNSKFILNKGYVSFDESLNIQRTGEFDILLIMESTADNIPGKAFEYVLSPKPTVVICPSNSVIRKEFQEVAGWYFVDSDKIAQEFTSVISNIFDTHHLERPIFRFSRDFQAKKYLNLLK